MSVEWSKAICTICFEDLKPIVEDLQAISICGHVFHELCLQQWVEYCPAGKKSSCPVCKQSCSQNNICRLYLQYIGDADTNIPPPLSPIRLSDAANAEALRRQVKQLEAKAAGISSASENQQRQLKQLDLELSLSKELVKREESMKQEALIEVARVRKLLQTKTEELASSTAECSKLQERSLNLAKELAAVKLVSTVNLEEEEVLKLASIGGGSNKEETIDILKKSLVLRNKSYKELLAQCSLLGRGESRSLKKLEKAKEKIKKLKTRLQELERTLEEKDNEILRTLKASKRINSEESNPTAIKVKYNSFLIKNSSGDFVDDPCESLVDLNNQTGLAVDSTFHANVNGIMSGCHQVSSMMSMKTENVVDLDPEADSMSWFDENADQTFQSKPKQSACERATEAKFCKDMGHVAQTLHSGASTAPYEEVYMRGHQRPVIEGGCKIEIDIDEDVSHVRNSCTTSKGLLPNIIMENKPLLPVKQEIPGDIEPIIRPGNQCAPGGLGSQGAKYAGKWCKPTQIKVFSEASDGDLIAVGADGKGGRIKVLRAKSPVDSRASLLWPKRCKRETKRGVESQGCLQIEHYFVKRES